MKDREQTKRRLLNAVGAIIETKGLGSIRISKVAREAGVDRKLIYRYFGNMDRLIEAYIVENDYWMVFESHLKHLYTDITDDNLKLVIVETMQGLFKYFFKSQKCRI